jgi:transposase
MTHKTIANEHGIDERTTQRWIATYIKKGVEGLQICRSGRSKSSITNEDKEIILSALFNDPHLFGYLRNTWSVRSLAKCLTNELGVPISFKHLQRITKDLGVRCKHTSDKIYFPCPCCSNLNIGSDLATQRTNRYLWILVASGPSLSGAIRPRTRIS